MPSDFVHLHVHTEFSLLDGQSQIKKLVKRAQELDMNALGITDHGVMFGAIDFFRACSDAGVKPVIGMEAYLAPRKMTDRDARLDKRPYHMLLLAQNMTGYQNLLKMASAAQLEGYYYRPRIDREFMAAHAEGIIATSGCLAAEIPRMVEDGDDSKAHDLIGWYQDVFGAENFFLELQNHNIDLLHRLNKWIYDYRQSGHSDVQVLATNDVHYVRKDDWQAHDTLLCIQTGALKSEENRMRMEPQDSYYLKSSQEMLAEFKGAPESLIREAFANSLKIAEMTDLNLSTSGYHLPNFPVPAGFDEGSYLRYLVEMGMNWRFDGDWRNEPVLTERIERELSIIHNMGFDTYFLIVWDLCEFARHADIWWNVRGSGAGSLVAYSLGITSIDPIQNSLLFERFLNPGRVSMPDIDLDYPDDRRGEMIAYAARKYGEDKVAAIITFGTMGAKAAVRDVARALNVDLPKVNKAVALIPQEAKQKKIREYVDMNPELLDMYNADPELRQVIDTAIELQGMTRHASTHAAGVIISDAPLVQYLPLHRITGTDPSGGALKAVTQFPMETAESIGLLKVDFLGLSTLTILRKACQLIERHQGIHYTMENIPYRHDDPKISDKQRKMLDETFEMMGHGDTVGVFQVESGGMQQMLRGMRPKVFENIIAGISLYRPGPMDFIPTYNNRLHGEEETEYHHPKLEPILKETYGIMVFQEQLMQIAGELFGYELGEADLMRRAVSKKKEKDLMKHKSIFIERGPENGIPADVSEAIFNDIEFFANYGFNKCLSGNTKILDSDTGRLVKIEDLYFKDIQIPQTISYDENDEKLVNKEISDVNLNGNKQVFRLKTKSGRTIEATANHPFLTYDSWKNLEELIEGSLIAVPHCLQAQGKNEWDLHEIYALADLIVTGNHWYFERILKHDKREESLIIDGYEKLIERLSDYMSSKVICNLPDEVFELVNMQISILLGAIWLKKGHFFPIYGYTEINLHSEILAQQIQHLLLRFGIFSYVREVPSKIQNFIQYRVVISDDYSLKLFNAHIASKIREASTEMKYSAIYFDKVNDIIDLQRRFGRICFDSLEDNEVRYIYWDEVESIESIGMEMTYDLTIEGTHNFVANDIIVHNSHAADYAVITVQTGYLKCHYPEEYMTALLIVQRDDSTKVATFLEECRRLQIPVLPPDVNYSQLDFDIEKQKNGKRGIRFGLAAVKNAGVPALEYLIDARGNRPFDNLKDFCQRVDLRKVGKRTMESLIKVGALVNFGTRSTLLAAMERIISYSGSYHKDKEIGQMNMFGDSSEIDDDLLKNLPMMEEYKPREMLKWEKELLGLYVTGRPVDRHIDVFRNQKLQEVSRLKSGAENGKSESVRIAGEIVTMRKITTKNNKLMAILQLEDWHESAGSIEVVLFPETYHRVMEYFAEKNADQQMGEAEKIMAEGEIVAIKGKLDFSRGEAQIIADDVSIDFETFHAEGDVPYFDDSEPDWAVTADISNMPEIPEPDYDEETGEIVNSTSHIEPPATNEGAIAPATQGASIPTPSVEPQFGGGSSYSNGSNGNGKSGTNGHHNNNDESEPEWVSDDDLLVLPDDMQENGQKRLIKVYMNTSKDPEKDRRRLRRLHGIFVQYPGNDQFTIIVRRPKDSLKLNFPNNTTGFCEELMRDLVSVVESIDNIELDRLSD